ncbi:ATP synthase F0F1 subunit A [Thalassospira lucentensis]|uniref:ATP synthase subunit a n=2 Tax=Thalassospira TaxID=168934 RepID=A0A154KY70_9PROT|nr:MULTISPECIES: F0F1 ATP synthase subunit A [Thalassospira]MBO9507383.1 F0F1 ATP synthase subunit A [Thalassospira sp. A3_1]KZB56750.1 ATP synthase F0F1 subunit A [Thalassospira xiamenensis]KZB64867.1 ATP synthase F0F1 subunit A [Thalassospira lucentensis]MCH2275800.1 F0F1 ATP synthase subunit A [Thalassospira sp.]MCK2166962.1 F0F1 ATP synthase subunit A [Thalassospira xiamenensis]
MAGPLEQFEIKPLAELSVAGVDVSFTNSALWMVIAAVLVTGFMTLSMRRGALVPGRWQGAAEVMYEFVANMLKDNVGTAGRKYFPFVFTLFMFVLFGNLLGMIPHSFTFTSHIAVTFAMALVIFIGVTIIGFVRHGTHYFRMFFPEGAPIATAFILIPIEVISYFSRPFSLAIRLFANMTVGHIMLKVIGGFVGLIGIFGVLPFALLTGITVLEFGIAALQAYVYTILTCIYLHDAIHMH